jgi:D-alanine transaminase
LVETLALWNGEVMPLARVVVPALDRGYLFGDSVYEVLRLYNGTPFLLAEHERRLERSLDGLRIAHPPGTLGAKIARLIDAGAAHDGLVYVQVSRGVAPRTHLPPAGIVPNELVYVQELAEAPYEAKRRAGVSVRLVADRRWGRCDLKTTNLLGNVIAADEARRGGDDEALLVDRDGFLTEGTHASFFAVVNGALVTTPLGEGILPGITRELVMQLAHNEGWGVREERLRAADWPKFQELFLTGTVTEIFPIVRVDGEPVGDGVPGAKTERLFKRFRALTRALSKNISQGK